MGVVQIDIQKREREFKTLSLSEANTVKWLLMFRDKVDEYFGEKQDVYFNNAGNVKAVNQELIGIYASLDNLISRCEFSEKQMEIIDMVCQGYSFKDISEITLEGNTQNCKRKFDTICKIIAEMDKYLWKVWANKVIVQGNTKKCERCSNELPLTNYFFGRDKRNRDGLQSTCKKCDSKRKIK